MEHRKFSPERLAHIRRLRRARLYHRQTPLFAFHRMQQEYPVYSYADFLDDLRRRTKRKAKRGKSTLQRYGRYARMQSLLVQYQLTGDTANALEAQQLRRHMTKPYTLCVKLHGEERAYTVSALVPYGTMQQLVRSLKACTEWAQAEDLIRRVGSHGK